MSTCRSTRCKPMKLYKGSFAELYGRIGRAKPPAGDCCRLGMHAYIKAGTLDELTVRCDCEDACDYAGKDTCCALYGLEALGDYVKEAEDVTH